MRRFPNFHLKNSITTMMSVKITKEELVPILRHIRKECTNETPYNNGEDIKTIKSAYLKTIKISGEKLKRIDSTRILVIKYYDNDRNFHSVNLSILTVYKYIPHIAVLQPSTN